MKLNTYLNPKLIVKSITEALLELKHYNNYKKIIEELDRKETLSNIGLTRHKDLLMIGINLNPELLMYEDPTQQESVELKMIAEKLKKYTNFLQNEGVLDVVRADYERVKTEDYYGYIVSISFFFKKYSKNRLIYDIIYASSVSITIISAVIYLLLSII